MFGKTQIKNRKANFLLLLSIALFCIAGSILAIVKDIDIDLKKADYVIGHITYANTRSIRTINIQHNIYKRAFYFKLNNSSQNFAIVRSDEAYDNLATEMKQGDIVKVYYQAGVGKYNTSVFQVEKGGRVIASYDDYNKELSAKTGGLLFMGTILLAYSIMWYRKFNLIRFLTSLVNVKQDEQQKHNTG